MSEQEQVVKEIGRYASLPSGGSVQLSASIVRRWYETLAAAQPAPATVTPDRQCCDTKRGSVVDWVCVKEAGHTGAHTDGSASWFDDRAYLQIQHARKQGDADGFQKGWHAALKRVSDGDSVVELQQLVPAHRDARLAAPLRHDQGLAIAKALRGEISHGKLAEILGIEDIHGFKTASGAFEEESKSARLAAIVQEMRRTIEVHRKADARWRSGGYELEATRAKAQADEAQFWLDQLAALLQPEEGK